MASRVYLGLLVHLESLGNQVLRVSLEREGQLVSQGQGVSGASQEREVMWELTDYRGPKVFQEGQDQRDQRGGLELKEPLGT